MEDVDWIYLAQIGISGGLFKYYNEFSGSMKGEEFYGQLSVLSVSQE
jgi:hypothetical protein